MRNYMTVFKNFLMAGAFGLVVAVPLAVSAQTVSPSNCGWSSWLTNNLTTCGTGTLLVYVQVLGQGSLTASNVVTVSVTGQNPTPAVFPGSVGGTLVTMGSGSYGVVATNSAGLTPSYSTGCNGTLYNGQTSTCVVTMSGSSPFYGQPTPYPYPYSTFPLTCSPASQTVGLGQTVTFRALGPGKSPFNWTTPDRTYLNAGSVLTTTLSTMGLQTVSVSSGAEVAQCVVTVQAAPVTTMYTTPSVIYTGTPATAAPVVVTAAAPTYVTPAYLPNTGFPPVDAKTVAYATLVLLGAAGMTYPYVKRALSVILG